MKIALDGSKAINESAGIAHYTRELIKNLIKIYPRDDFFLYFNFLRGGERKKALIKELVGNNKNVKTKIYPIPGWLKERFHYLRYSALGNLLRGNDIYHATEFLSFDNGLKIPQILTVHDLTMIKFPYHRGREVSNRHGEMLKRACQNASSIISVSESTKKDIIDVFKINPKKIQVIYSGRDPRYKIMPDKTKVRKFLEKKYHLKFPFMLFVSTIEPRKNVPHLLRAFDKFSGQRKEYSLVLVGKRGWNTEEVDETYKRLKNKHKIKFMNYVPASDLVYFYNGATLLCYPSIYEGFGHPVLEAMASGTPVLTSRVSSLPEVGGAAAYYIDPNSPEEISRGMEKIVDDQDYRKQMIKNGLIQVKKFSWEKSAKETYKLYEKVLKNDRKN